MISRDWRLAEPWPPFGKQPIRVDLGSGTVMAGGPPPHRSVNKL